jgi:adenosylhomocysteine/aminodeoxyfutalosine nucleosidase
MIEKYGCDTLLFSGVAGGINPELKIGDLIVANKLSQHDLDITAFGHSHGFVPGGSVYVETSEKLKNIALDVASENNIKIIEGTIATGDQFIADEKRKEFIEKTFKADALEMEGASVAVVCDALNVPCLILRAISDTADMDAGFNFDEFLETSAKNSADFLVKIINKL